ncbi:MAG: hydroxyacid dehydrogenase, partial [Nanoarchaeota archaeon]
MKIVFFGERIIDRKLFKKSLEGHEVIFISEPISEESTEKTKDADIVSIDTDSNMDKKIISKLPELKLVVTRSTGFDHIDVEECRRR